MNRGVKLNPQLYFSFFGALNIQLTMLTIAVLSILFGLNNAQSSSDCVYRQGGLELDLLAFKGKFLAYEEDNYQWTYTICSDSLSCVHESNTVNAMVEGHAVGINECHYYGIYNESTQPFYDVCSIIYVIIMIG